MEKHCRRVNIFRNSIDMSLPVIISNVETHVIVSKLTVL